MGIDGVFQGQRMQPELLAKLLNDVGVAQPVHIDPGHGEFAQNLRQLLKVGQLPFIAVLRTVGQHCDYGLRGRRIGSIDRSTGTGSKILWPSQRVLSTRPPGMRHGVPYRLTAWATPRV